MAALGINENDAIAAFGSIECRSVFQYRHLLHILRIEVEHEVDIVAIVKSRARLLHVLHHPIDHDEGLCIGRQRVQAANEHG